MRILNIFNIILFDWFSFQHKSLNYWDPWVFSNCLTSQRIGIICYKSMILLQSPCRYLLQVLSTRVQKYVFIFSQLESRLILLFSARLFSFICSVSESSHWSTIQLWTGWLLWSHFHIYVKRVSFHFTCSNRILSTSTMRFLVM